MSIELNRNRDVFFRLEALSLKIAVQEILTRGTVNRIDAMKTLVIKRAGEWLFMRGILWIIVASMPIDIALGKCLHLIA